jgi:hypothetical protein
MYVDVPEIARIASGLGFSVCLFSILIWLLTGFYLVYPPASVLICAFCAMFFSMSYIIKKKWIKN